MRKKYFTFLFIIISLLVSNIHSVEEEDEEFKTYYFYFDLSDPSIQYKNSSEKIENIVTDSISIKIPNILLVKEGFYFNGWTEDFIYGYQPGDIFKAEKTNITLYPIFENKSDTTYFRFEYIVEYNGEYTDVSKELRPTIERQNHLILISSYSYSNDYATSLGWTDGTNYFSSSTRLLMPRRNVTLYAVFYNYHKLYYSHGDVDGIVGNPDAPLVYREGASIDLAESSRLARMGYKIVGWHCEYDGKDYPIFYPYILPDADVVMTAIWEPIEYTIAFQTLVSGIPNIKLKGRTGEIIIAPNIEDKREGYIFGGWIVYGNKYTPGDEIFVQGQMPGLGISGKAIWYRI